MAFHDYSGTGVLFGRRNWTWGKGICFGGPLRTDDSCVYRMWIIGLCFVAGCKQEKKTKLTRRTSLKNTTETLWKKKVKNETIAKRIIVVDQIFKKLSPIVQFYIDKSYFMIKKVICFVLWYLIFLFLQYLVDSVEEFMDCYKKTPFNIYNIYWT